MFYFAVCCYVCVLSVLRVLLFNSVSRYHNKSHVYMISGLLLLSAVQGAKKKVNTFVNLLFFRVRDPNICKKHVKMLLKSTVKFI